jgi:hypothetical protein
MLIILLLVLSFFNVFAGSPFDQTVFFILPKEYNTKFIYNELQLGFRLTNLTSTFYYSQPAFYGKKCLDINYIQQLFNISLAGQVEDYLLFKTVFRTRYIWGSNQEGFLIDEVNTNLVGSVLPAHTHNIDFNFFWLREGWVALDVSRFMCVEKSIVFQAGRIPYEVGRGISFGQAYLLGKGFLGYDSTNIIDEFSTGFLLTTEIYADKKTEIFGEIYATILTNRSVYLEEILEPIYKNRIFACGDSFNKDIRGFGHIGSAIIARLLSQHNFNSFIINAEPYIIWDVIPELNLEFPAQGKSSLVTLGCMIEGTSSGLNFNLEWAINKGGLNLYGWDRNYLKIKNRNGNLVEENNYVLENNLPALADFENEKIIESSPQGTEFNGKNISSDLLNSKRRFTDPRYIKFEGSMFVCDIAYWCRDQEFLIATTFGFASGGNDPIYDVSDNKYGGFIGIQELYTGLWVLSAFSPGGPLARNIEQDFLLEENYENSLVLFSDLKFFGASVRFDFFDKKLILLNNVIGYWTFCQPKAFDKQSMRTVNDLSIDNYLGTEFVFGFIFSAIFNLDFYLVYALFFPGGRYINENLGPLNPLEKYYLKNKINLNKFYPVNLIDVGFYYNF